MGHQRMAIWRLLQTLQSLMWLHQVHLFPAKTKFLRMHSQKVFLSKQVCRFILIKHEWKKKIPDLLKVNQSLLKTEGI